jgi:hypothetical protein
MTAATAVVTFRLDTTLLAALKRKARRDGGTVSASLVAMVRTQVEPRRRRTAKRRATMGMFPDFEAPELDEMMQLRRGLSRRLMSAMSAMSAVSPAASTAAKKPRRR